MSAAVRRRRLALAAIAAAALATGIVVGAGAGGGKNATAPSTAAHAPACPDEIASNPARLAGQMLVVRMEATATDDLRERLADGELGGVILFPPAGADPAALGDQVMALRQAAVAAGMPAPLVAIDQEGGDVARLPGLPPDRSPAAVARGGPKRATAEGRATGTALRELGIDVDLAPVLDVPSVAGAFIGTRALSDDSAEVSELGVAFGTALQAAGVAATAKHFPGLGAATDNTDLGPSTVDVAGAELEAGLEPFRAAAAAGFDLVMVANATYPALDPRRPASQSPRVIDGLLRGELGYDGVVITDDVGAGALTAAGLDEGTAAVGAIAAGADLALVALGPGEQAFRALRRAVRSGELDRDAVVASCARTTALRERLAVSPPAGP